ncbi:MAG: glycine--tRNA ligase subunit beta [Gammaproteobacteria bacterium]|nr:glycine--tRNA ligase subunit beta [Gammaproteobacteria bacterium]
MSEVRDLLIEIGTEELPPKALLRLSTAFTEAMQANLEQAGLGFASVHAFASPRRLALLVRELQTHQADKDIERRGPALQAAFDDQGNPSKAALGFANSCGVEVSALDKLETDKGSWLVYRARESGAATSTLIPAMVNDALNKLPIPKRMRWADLDAQFVRPVHWIVLLFGDDVIDDTILSVQSNRETRGHRFLHNKSIYIPAPAEYEVLLESEGKVIADFARRRETIRGQVEQAAHQLNGVAVIDKDLLDEVTSMVEWPVAVIGNFEQRFLQVPQEALISTMSANQKYFHVLDKQGKLLAHFITISNIESRDPDKVREGNERVIRPRFADAEFFWNQDRKQALASRLEQLKSVVFQKQLGTLYDKTQRVARLAETIAMQIDGDKLQALRAAELCKCDLMTAMVGEFPELQGVMGRYYAQHDGEPGDVARAIDEHYMPRFAGDQLPQTKTGQAVAIADRLDTLLGIIAVGQLPTGDKDPYALRRAALGVLRCMVEHDLALDLMPLLSTAAEHFPKDVKAKKAIDATIDFILERLRVYYTSQDIKLDVFESVFSQRPTQPNDFNARVLAVNAFRQLVEAESLSAANKRISNILKKTDEAIPATVDEGLLESTAEKALAKQVQELSEQVAPLIADRNYTEILHQLAALRSNVDSFFDDVMVMVDNQALRQNRLALLSRLRNLFLQVADISQLQGTG